MYYIVVGSRTSYNRYVVGYSYMYWLYVLVACTSTSCMY